VSDIIASQCAKIADFTPYSYLILLLTMIYHDTGPTAKTRCAQQLCGPARRKAAKKLR